MNKNILGVDIRHLTLFRSRLEVVSREEQFKKIATMFIGAEYKMGSENFNECDCSGLICSALRGMGYNIRINANDIITTCCTQGYSDGIGIVGFYDNKAEKYSHVGIIFHSPSKEMILHSSYPTGCSFEDSENCTDRYLEKGYGVHYYTLNFNKIEEMDGKTYGLDEDFK